MSTLTNGLEKLLLWSISRVACDQTPGLLEEHREDAQRPTEYFGNGSSQVLSRESRHFTCGPPVGTGRGHYLPFSLATAPTFAVTTFPPRFTWQKTSYELFLLLFTFSCYQNILVSGLGLRTRLCVWLATPLVFSKDTGKDRWSKASVTVEILINFFYRVDRCYEKFIGWNVIN